MMVWVGLGWGWCGSVLMLCVLDESKCLYVEYTNQKTVRSGVPFK